MDSLMENRHRMLANTLHEKTIIGNPIVITDNYTQKIKNLEVSFEPKQDFNGYDHPWVGGTGKNLLPYYPEETATYKGITLVRDKYGVLTLNGTAEGTTDVQFGILFYLPVGQYFFSGCQANTGGKVDVYMWETTASKRMKQWDGTTNSVSDYGRSFDNQILSQGNDIQYRYTIRIVSGYTCNNVIIHPMIRKKENIDITYEPYENICPLIGYEEIKINKGKKNLLYGVPQKKYYSGDGDLITGESCKLFDYIPLGACSYVINFKKREDVSTSSAVRIAWFDENKKFLKRTIVEQSSCPYIIPINPLIENAKYIRIGYFESTDEEVQIEIGNSLTIYEPPFSQQYICTWKNEIGEVFKGKINLITGILTINSIQIICGESITPLINNRTTSGGYANLNYTEGGLYFETGWTSSKPEYFKYARANTPEGVSDKLIYDTTHQEGTFLYQNDTKYLYPNGDPINYIYIYLPKNQGLNTLEAKRAYLKDNPIKIIYPLKNPWTYQLNPQQISLLKNGNTLITDVGEISLTYWTH